MLAAFPVVVRVGKGYVEACPKGINKGVMAERMIEIASRSGAASPKNPQPPGGPRGMPAAASSPGLGFVLCVGDDSSDELMFQVRALSPSNRTSRPASLTHRTSPPHNNRRSTAHNDATNIDSDASATGNCLKDAEFAHNCSIISDRFSMIKGRA